jgi:ubiquinone/menaquinone biosynthesis C-methylase UbiE
MTSALFDSIAQQYDGIFTNSIIGKLQRNRVRNYLDSWLPKHSLNILELNCGTGEDAIWFAKRGHNVLATDISEQMISITQNKIANSNLDQNIRTQKLDIYSIDRLLTSIKFDLVFSNFGGLNCLSGNEINSVSNKIKKLLNPDGKFIAVVMSDFCLIESIYFLFKLRLSDIFRRKKNQQVDINGSSVLTYYYHPKRFHKFFIEDFVINKTIAIGLFIPPSYLNNYFSRKNKILKTLNTLENIFGDNSVTASMSDHFLIDLNPRK